jgi:hypothetical protein
MVKREEDELTPISDLVADDPSIADVAYWDGLPEPEYAKPDSDVAKRIRERREQLLKGTPAPPDV